MSQAFDQVKAQEESLLCRSYSRYPIAVARGKGSRLWDVDGKEYVDLLAGIAVTGLGHCNDEVTAALVEQAGRLWHVSNLFYQEPQLELARRLLAESHHGKVFFCNSGAEANEAAIKLARRYMRKARKRPRAGKASATALRRCPRGSVRWKRAILLRWKRPSGRRRRP